MLLKVIILTLYTCTCTHGSNSLTACVPCWAAAWVNSCSSGGSPRGPRTTWERSTRAPMPRSCSSGWARSWARCPSISRAQARRLWRSRSAKPWPSLQTRRCGGSSSPRMCAPWTCLPAAERRWTRWAGGCCRRRCWRGPTWWSCSGCSRLPRRSPTRSLWRARAAWRRTRPFPRVCRAGVGGPLQESTA